MKFLADECCDIRLVEAMRRHGIDVLYVQETLPGCSDSVVLDRAYQEKRILITEDKDFGELVYHLRKPAVGIILIRISTEESAAKWLRIKNLIENHADRLSHYFVIATSQKYRFRPLLYPPTRS